MGCSSHIPVHFFQTVTTTITATTAVTLCWKKDTVSSRASPLPTTVALAAVPGYSATTARRPLAKGKGVGDMGWGAKVDDMAMVARQWTADFVIYD